MQEEITGLNWDALAAIATAVGAIATFLAAAVALWLPFHMRKPKIEGCLTIRLGPTSETDGLGQPVPYKTAPENWLKQESVLKEMQLDLRNLSGNPVWVTHIEYRDKRLGKPKPLTFINGQKDTGKIEPYGFMETLYLPLMKLNAEKIRKVWTVDSMKRRWRIKHVAEEYC